MANFRLRKKATNEASETDILAEAGGLDLLAIVAVLIALLGTLWGACSMVDRFSYRDHDREVHLETTDAVRPPLWADGWDSPTENP